MKIFSFCYRTVYVIFTIIANTLANSVYEANFHARNGDDLKQYPVKRKVINVEQPYFAAAHEEDSYPDPSFVENQSAQRYRRVEDNKPQSLIDKRSGLIGVEKRPDRLYKRDLTFPVASSPMRSPRREENYGIVYGNGRPIGILEPFPQAYEFSPFMNQREGVEEIDPLPPPPRRAAMDILYPADSRLGATALVNEWGENNVQDNVKVNERETKTKTEQKRSPVGITNEKIAELKSALSRIQNPGPSDKVTEIEDDLHDILSDMGLVDDEGDKNLDCYKNKREVRNTDDQIKKDISKEDENLEEGINRIELNKADHEVTKRDNRNEKIDELEKNKNPNQLDASAIKLKRDDGSIENSNIDPIEAKNAEESSSALKSTGQDETSDGEETQKHVNVKRSAAKLVNYQKEGEGYIRNKRQESKSENNDLMKGLEKSGDLTVSGNKSPLASSGNEAEIEKKSNKDQTTYSPSEKDKREQDELEYQKQVERNIQSKIDAIKEQVKREIEALKAREDPANKQESQRKKREAVNTLIEEERSALDPQKYPDEKLIPHVRRRRNLEDSLKGRRRIKRGLPDFSNLNNIDTGDYLDLTERRRTRSNRDLSFDYQMDPQENSYLPEESLQNVKGTADETMKNKRDTNAQNSNEKVDDSSSSNQSEEKKTNAAAVENEQQIRNDHVAPGESNNQAIQKRNVDVTYNPDPDLSSVANIQKNEESANRVKRDSKDEKENRRKKEAETNPAASESSEKKQTKTRQKDDSQNIEVGSSKKEKAKDEFATMDSDLNLESKLKNEKNRRRRQIDLESEQNQDNIYSRRNKRASAILPYAKSAFFPYRAEEEEGDDEGDEFDDDTFEDHATLQKRDVYNPKQYRRSPDYQRLQDYDYSYANNYQPEKRSLANKYVANMNADVYENPNNYLYNPSTYVRRKRQDNEQLAALHGGGPMLHHLAAVRERNMQTLNEDERRSKRNFRKIGQNSGNENVKEEPENIADLSDADLFGALPQSYDGSNLLRFKRVKRENSDAKIHGISGRDKQGTG